MKFIITRTKKYINWADNQVNLSKSQSCSYPQLHTSIAGVYLSSPRSNSGGRYHNVITLLVYGRLKVRTKDKRACWLVLSHTGVSIIVNVTSVVYTGGSPLFGVIQPS